MHIILVGCRDRVVGPFSLCKDLKLRLKQQAGRVMILPLPIFQ